MKATKAEKLTAGEADRIRQAVGIIDTAFLWSKTPEGRDYWREVCDNLRAIAENGTTDGRPWGDPVKPQSVDSAWAGFVMPDNWHWRKVDASSLDHIIYDVRLIGWDASGQAKYPYCVTDGEGYILWTEHVRFTDGDTCD